ncbi:MAG: HD domain-containing protein [Treponema sp.]|nr:HD domain-containing protein [Treponema sp.]
MTGNIHPVLKEIASFFNNSGKEIYLVGGAVRDMLMGKKIHDWDLATNALPEEVTEIMKRSGGKVIPTGIKHGTVTVFYKRKSAEITTFRTESGYSDGRRPDQVTYAADIEEDLSRRDFTMNAIALCLPGGEAVDPFNGKKDIKAKIIRCVGDAKERFSEDGLRPLRAVRFASQLGFQIEKNTLEAISGALETSAKVSQERVRTEIDKILDSSLPSDGFRLMEKTGLLKLFIAELDACRGVEQKGFHQYDVLDHSLLACDYAAANCYSREVRLAALLHDIGKPKVRGIDSAGVYTFYRHEEVSVGMSREILSRLRYPNTVIDKTSHLIKEHMFLYTEQWSDAAVRRFIARVGEDNLDDIYSLRRADIYGFSGKEPDYRSIEQLVERVNKVLTESRAFTVKDLAVNGNDLMSAGIPGGKIMGCIFKELLETVLDDPAQNKRETLLEIADRIYKRNEAVTTCCTRLV